MGQFNQKNYNFVFNDSTKLILSRYHLNTLHIKQAYNRLRSHHIHTKSSF